MGVAISSRAQRATHPHRVAVLGLGFSSDTPDALKTFFDGMGAHGYREGNNVVYERRYTIDRNRLPALAAELVAWRPDVAFANVSSVAQALKAKSTTLPIVMGTAIDPVAEGLARSLGRPDGNVTGLSSLAAPMHEKLIEVARAILPNAQRVAFLINPDHMLAKTHEETALRAGKSQRLDVHPYYARSGAEAVQAVTSAARAKLDALIVSADADLFGLRSAIIENAARHRLPTIGVQGPFAREGALAAYGHDLAESFRRASYYVDRILKGAKAGELPIEQPTKFELVINLKTAKMLGIAVPQAVLLRADRVLE